MGDGRIFLKILRDTSFNKDLSNEPNIGLIHLERTRLMWEQIVKCKRTSFDGGTLKTLIL